MFSCFKSKKSHHTYLVVRNTTTLFSSDKHRLQSTETLTQKEYADRVANEKLATQRTDEKHGMTTQYNPLIRR